MVACPTIWLLAQADSYVHMSRRFQPGGHSFSFLEAGVWLLLITGAVGLAWCAYHLYNRMLKNRQRSPAWLFRELCDAHGLCWSDRQLLQWLARSHNLPHASHLFLRPGLFNTAALPPDMAAWRERVGQLRDTLFGKANGIGC
jgi:hypothetical protein